MMTDYGFLAIEEPVTQYNIRNDFKTLALRQGAQDEAVHELVRNECRRQMVPEKQKTMRRATATLAGFEFSSFMLFEHGPEAEWTGNREGTYIKEFTNADEVQSSLWPKEQNGWIRPGAHRPCPATALT
jgi:hypothetical protein